MDDRPTLPPYGAPRPTPAFANPENTAQQGRFPVASDGDATGDQIGIFQSSSVGSSKTEFLPDLRPYKFTIGEAIDRFAAAGRNCPSLRTMQRYCQEGAIDCYKVTVNRDGVPVSEWLVHETSLAEFIERRPPYGDAGDAKPQPENVKDVTDQPADMATPLHVGDANTQTKSEKDFANSRDDMATPPDAGDAKTETRTLGEVLIDNARLTAELDGHQALIEELRDDKAFMREELVEARTHRADVKEIAERTLKTLETIAIGGKLEELPEAPRTERVNTSSELRVHHAEEAERVEPGDNVNSDNRGDSVK